MAISNTSINTVDSKTDQRIRSTKTLTIARGPAITQEIIEMAKHAGLAHFYDSESQCTGITDADLVTAEKEKNDARLVKMLMPFAKLVASAASAKEREALLDVVYGYAHSLSWNEDFQADI